MIKDKPVTAITENKFSIDKTLSQKMDLEEQK